MHSSQNAYRISNPNGLHFVTFTIVDWVDVFSRCAYRDVLIDNFRFYQNQRGLHIYGYVVMTNHVHALLGQPDSQWTQSDTIRDFMKMTARQIIEKMQTEPESRRE
jgi:putative transposase